MLPEEVVEEAVVVDVEEEEAVVEVRPQEWKLQNLGVFWCGMGHLGFFLGFVWVWVFVVCLWVVLLGFGFFWGGKAAAEYQQLYCREKCFAYFSLMTQWKRQWYLSNGKL